MRQTPNQRTQILAHLQNHGSITPLEALNLYGCFRLASRMAELKKLEIPFTVVMKESNGKRFAEYKLEKV